MCVCRVCKQGVSSVSETSKRESAPIRVHCAVECAQFPSFHLLSFVSPPFCVLSLLSHPIGRLFIFLLFLLIFSLFLFLTLFCLLCRHSTPLRTHASSLFHPLSFTLLLSFSSLPPSPSPSPSILPLPSSHSHSHSHSHPHSHSNALYSTSSFLIPHSHSLTHTHNQSTRSTHSIQFNNNSPLE